MPGPRHLRARRARHGLEIGGESTRRHAGAASTGGCSDRTAAARRPAPGTRPASRWYSARKRVPAQRLDHELHAVALLVLVVAELVEHAQHRFGDVEDLGRRQELVDRRRRLHMIAVPPPTTHAETARAVLDRGAKAEVVDAQQRVIFVGAPLERDLELARQRRAERMAQQDSASSLRRTA